MKRITIIALVLVMICLEKPVCEQINSDVCTTLHYKPPAPNIIGSGRFPFFVTTKRNLPYNSLRKENSGHRKQDTCQHIKYGKPNLSVLDQAC